MCANVCMSVHLCAHMCVHVCACVCLCWPLNNISLRDVTPSSLCNKNLCCYFWVPKYLITKSLLSIDGVNCQILHILYVVYVLCVMKQNFTWPFWRGNLLAWNGYSCSVLSVHSEHWSSLQEQQEMVTEFTLRKVSIGKYFTVTVHRASLCAFRFLSTVNSTRCHL